MAAVIDIIKKALSPNRVIPLDKEGCGKMAKAHTAPGFAGDAPFLSTQTGDRAFIFITDGNPNIISC